MRRSIRAAAVGIVVAVLGFGCSSPEDGLVEPIDAPVSDEDSGDNVEVEPEPDAAEYVDPEPEADVDPAPEIDISVIPDEITLEYVDAVLVELERLYAEAIAISASEGEVGIQAADRLRSAFSSEQFDLRIAELIGLADSGFQGFSIPSQIRPRTHEGLELLDVASTCLWVRTLIDYSGLSAVAMEREQAALRLEVTDKSVLVVDESETPWVISSIPVGLSTSAMEDLRCD